MTWTQRSGEWLAAKVGMATRREMEERIVELEEENGRLRDVSAELLVHLGELCEVRYETRYEGRGEPCAGCYDAVADARDVLR